MAHLGPEDHPEFDDTSFFHDVPAELVAESARRERGESELIFREPCRFEQWPEIPIHVIAGRGDRCFPIELQRRVARERLGLDVAELPGGHLMALSQPEPLAERLLAYHRSR